MCACRLEASSSPPTPQASPVHDLEDYYPYLSEMDRRSDGSSSDTEDVYSQLAQKERDLILAAELGKALLEKNQELSKKNESLNEEYGQKLEELMQEKHELRLRLEAVEQEYELTVRELQHDVASLRHELEQTEEQSRTSDRAKSQIIHELTQQNERLTEQLRKASVCEDQLQTQVMGMRQQVSARRSSMHAHVQQLAVLREEITLLTEQKTELERRISLLTDERDSARCEVEESTDRIMMLEKQKLEHEQKIRGQDREIGELEDHVTQLEDKVETLSLQASTSVFETSTHSLYNELEMSQNNLLPHSMSTDSLDDSSDRPTTPYAPVMSTPRPHSLSLTAIMFPTPPLCDDDIECDDDIAMTTNLTVESLHDMQYLARLKNPDVNPENFQLKQEVSDAFRLVQKMVFDLKGKEEVHSPGQLTEAELHAGSLVDLLKELKELMQTIVQQQIAQGMPTTPPKENEQVIDDLEVKVKELQDELGSTQEQLLRLRADMDLKDNELRQKSDELKSLANKVKLSLQHQELLTLQAERDQLQNKAAGITRDDVVDEARAERDDAVTKRNSMELELAQAKLDLMSLDSQLMEAIQQKVALSQQLEQWQDDMQELIEIQMTKRIKSEDKVEETISKENSPATRKRHPFWS